MRVIYLINWIYNTIKRYILCMRVNEGVDQDVLFSLGFRKHPRVVVQLRLNE